MADTIIQKGEVVNLTVSSGTKSGDLCVVGQLVGIALKDADGSNKTEVYVGGSVVRLTVKAVDGSGNSAVAVGDALYYVSADTPPISKKSTGVHIGWALEAISTGQTATIKVKLKTF